MVTQELDLSALTERIRARVNQGLPGKPARSDFAMWDAWRRLFSTLAHLEQIAVIAAERGDGIEGQLEDEIVHREVFAALAGEAMAPTKAVRALQDFIGNLSGPASMAVLNIVAESWLETLFRHVARWGLADEMFAGIGEEEARHVTEAEANLVNVDGGEVEPLVRELERLLFDIAREPAFMLPLTFFGGVNQVAAMGADQTKAHAHALKALGLEPTAYATEIARCGRDMARDPEPSLVPSSAWQETAFKAGVPPITASVDIPWKHGADPREIESRVVRAVSSAIAGTALNATVRNTWHEIYAPKAVIVGVRRLYSRGLVTTVYAHEPHLKTVEEVTEGLVDGLRRQKLFPYDAPDYAGLSHLLPASRVAATVTNCTTQFPVGTRGWSSLVPVEGATISCVISPVFKAPVKGFLRTKWVPHINLGFEVDHRVHDGAAFGKLIEGVKNALTE